MCNPSGSFDGSFAPKWGSNVAVIGFYIAACTLSCTRAKLIIYYASHLFWTELSELFSVGVIFQRVMPVS